MQRIVLNSVTKRFHRQQGPKLLRNIVAGVFKSNPGHSSERPALQNVSFTVRDGEAVGILGHNGAGKSTLLNIITGASDYDSGSVKVSGKVAGLLELGSGFHGDLTGRENLRLNAALLGMSAGAVRENEQSIINFAGIPDMIDAPLRTYSSGMVMRLAFAVAIHIDPDILLIDEIIGVGDQAFQNKCFDRIQEFRSKGKTILFVSHSPGLVATYCSRAIWLDQGRLVEDGDMAQVIANYMEAMGGGPILANPIPEPNPAPPKVQRPRRRGVAAR